MAIVDNDQTRRISGVEPLFGQCRLEHLEQAKLNLEKHFAMVGLTNRFDESLLLIMRALKWDKDLYYVPELVNRSRPAIRDIPESVKNIIEEKNKYDRQLFQFASRRLDDKISAQEYSFTSELENFRSSNEKYLKSGHYSDIELGSFDRELSRNQDSKIKNQDRI
jgi:hypothetical protein